MANKSELVRTSMCRVNRWNEKQLADAYEWFKKGIRYSNDKLGNFFEYKMTRKVQDERHSRNRRGNK